MKGPLSFVLLGSMCFGLWGEPAYREWLAGRNCHALALMGKAPSPAVGLAASLENPYGLRDYQRGFAGFAWLRPGVCGAVFFRGERIEGLYNRLSMEMGCRLPLGKSAWFLGTGFRDTERFAGRNSTYANHGLDAGAGAFSPWKGLAFLGGGRWEIEHQTVTPYAGMVLGSEEGFRTVFLAKQLASGDVRTVLSQWLKTGPHLQTNWSLQSYPLGASLAFAVFLKAGMHATASYGSYSPLGSVWRTGMEYWKDKPAAR